jgi:signal peptidase I
VLKRLGSLVFALVALYLTVPQRFGGLTEYAIVNGKSMEPTFHTGDLIIARPADSYRVGQVVVYRIPDDTYSGSYRIVHRLHERTPADKWIIKGDNNEGTDAWEVPDSHIVGRKVVMIPKGGYLLSWMMSPIFIGLCIGMSVFWSMFQQDEASVENDAADQKPQNEPPDRSNAGDGEAVQEVARCSASEESLV